MTAKPGTFNKVPSQVSMRIPRVRPSVIKARNTKARWEVIAETKRRYDVLAEPGTLAAGKEFAADILSALGLDGKTDCPPAPVQLVEPGDATAIHAGRGVKAAKSADTRHTPRKGYTNGCRCDPCRDHYNAQRREYRRRKRDERAADFHLSSDDTAREGS